MPNLFYRRPAVRPQMMKAEIAVFCPVLIFNILKVKTKLANGHVDSLEIVLWLTLYDLAMSRIGSPLSRRRRLP